MQQSPEDEGKATTVIPVRASLAEVERLLVQARQMSPWDCAKDQHFAHYVFGHIQTEVQAFDLLEELIRDNYRNGPAYAVKAAYPSICHKVASAESYLKSGCLSPARALASARRTHCSCHATGSFALAIRLPGRGTPKARVKHVFRKDVECQRGSDGRYVIHEKQNWCFLCGGNTASQAWAAADKALEEHVVQRWRDHVNGVNQPEPLTTTQTIVLHFPPPKGY